MSMIHSSWALLGCKSELIAGTARCSTVRSITYSKQAIARTPRPTHSRTLALGGVVVTRSLATALPFGWLCEGRRAPNMEVIGAN